MNKLKKLHQDATSIDLSELDDLLAVVEAARILVENQKGGKMNPLAWDSLDKALAKLDEEDKNV